MPQKPLLYLDYAAAAPQIPEVLAMHAELCRRFFINPHGTSCQAEQCRRELLKAEKKLLSLIGATPSDAFVVWTSGGTEALNLAVNGIAQAFADFSIAVDPTGHPGLLEPCLKFKNHVTFAKVGGCGTLSFPASARKTIAAVCHANNETGTLQDLKDIRKSIGKDAILIVDGMQSFSKASIPWKEAGIDLLAIGGRKFGGPASCGALIVKKGTELSPLLLGGGQQKNLRSGTLDTVSVVEFTAAAEISVNEMKPRTVHAKKLNEFLRKKLMNEFIKYNPIILSPEVALPQILSFSLPGKEAAVLMRILAEENILVGTGSACSAESGKTSHVLAAMGYSEKVSRGVLRVSTGPSTSISDLQTFLNALRDALACY